MRRLALVLALLVGCAVSASAQLTATGVGGGFGAAAGGGAYSGPGDIVAASAWWGLRAYSLAKVNTAAANICNAADATCADVNSLTNGNFDVATATGAPLNCGGAGGTCTVKILYDQTGNTNCAGAACTMSQATIAQRFTLTLNCLGSLPCMTITSGHSGFIASNVLTVAGSSAQPYTLSFAAARIGNLTSFSDVVSDTNTNIQLGFGSTTTDAFMYAGSVVTATGAAASTFVAVQTVYNGASSDLNVNGTAHSVNPGAAGANNSLQLGATGGASPVNTFDGQLTEAGMWMTIAFSGANSTAMSANQRAYWGF